MKTKIILAAATLLAASVTANAQVFGRNADQGTIIGGIAGAIIGNNSGIGDGGKGALIGAGAGLIFGAIADSHEQRYHNHPPRIRAGHPGVEVHHHYPRHRPYPHGTRYKMVVTEVVIYDDWGVPHVRRHYSYIPYRY